MPRQKVPEAIKREVLIEAGFRCAVPTCRGILAIDLHHLEEVSDGGGNTLGNLIALCPTCHALYTRGTIPRSAIQAYKVMLVSLSAAFDSRGIEDLLFLHKATQRRNLVITGDGVLRFTALIGSGYADYQLLVNNANQIVTYTVGLTQKGILLVDAWMAGDRESLANVLGTET